MAPEYLSSNVMNYIVYRYLTEAGFLTSADALKRSWVGTSPGSDPERLPFAKYVKKHALIELVQDGLFLDDLEAKARHETPPRFVFGNDHGPNFALQAHERREPQYVPQQLQRMEQDHETEIETGAEVQTPVPPARKAKKRRAPAERRAVNGDAIEAEVNDAVQPPTMETSVEPMETEPRPPTPVIPTLHIGSNHDTQTEKPRDLSADVTFINRDNPIPILEWHRGEPQVLFAGGLDQSELFKIGNSATAAGTMETDLQHIELPTGPSGQYEVERFCWTADAQAVAVVSETSSLNLVNRPVTRLVRLRNWGADMQILGPITGMVLALQYQPASQLLLCICGLENKSVMHVWRLTSSGSELVGRRRPTGTKEQHMVRIYDGAWITPTRFIVCGDCDLQIYETQNDIQLALQCALPEGQRGGQNSENKTWSRLRFDKLSNYVAVVETNEGAMQRSAVYQTPANRMATNVPSADVWHRVFLPSWPELKPMTEIDEITEIQWQPVLNEATFNAATDERLLGFSTTAGNVELYAIRPSRTAEPATHQQIAPFTVTPLRRFCMGELYTAATFAFSPDGYLVAAAGFDAVFIWRTDDVPNRGLRAIWRCRGGPGEDNAVNGSRTALWKSPEYEEDFDWPQSIQWDSDGRKLAFGVNDRVAIIRI